MKKRMVFLMLPMLLLMMAVVGCGKKVEVKLLPETANLDFAGDIVVEPAKPPYNLGGWRDGEPMWVVKIPEKGMYKVSMEYSRPGRTGKAKGVVRLEHDGRDPHELSFTVQPTGKDGGDWSVYKVHEIGGASLEAGTWQISVEPLERDASSGTEYFVNLRSVTLLLDE